MHELHIFAAPVHVRLNRQPRQIFVKIDAPASLLKGYFRIDLHGKKVFFH